ncbi:MAG: dihydrolipoyl dehydrogenase [Cocleimonas sp.]|nr:dihydrolipoyl dehydrogenase [Cocleimonas sp.]
MTIDINIPDIGDFDEVEVIEVLVKKGDEVQPEDSLITVESDKASMEIPAPSAGTIADMKVKVGDKVKQGSLLATLTPSSTATAKEDATTDTATDTAQQETRTAEEAPTASNFTGDADQHAPLVVLGSGPGGYTAAFRAADLGVEVILIEKYDNIGGVCLNVGCIPSKALLHTAEVINEAAEADHLGVSFNKPKIDIDKVRDYKSGIVSKLTGGLKQLAKQRKVTIVHGYGKFTSANSIEVVADDGGKSTIGFDNCIIAAGSRVTKLPFIPWEDPRVMDSTDALELEEVPKRMLVVGGGIIGLEMATVYDALGTDITVVELGTGLMPGADRDLVRPLERRIKKKYENIFLNTKVSEIKPTKKGLVCTFEGGSGSTKVGSKKGAPETDTFDRVLVSIGRSPNGKLIDAEKAGVAVNDWGFIEVDKQQRTNVDHIYAIGDVVGQPMLAHKATHEGKTAAENVAGHKAFFDARAIPSVAYTDPEIAWMGKTEDECKAEGIEVKKGAFPWAASGRSLSIGRNEGMTKVLFDKESGQLIGAGIVGTNAGELIAEAVLALEMGADAEDIGLTVHPHPTLSETLNFAAEVAEGTCTDIYVPKKK